MFAQGRDAVTSMPPCILRVADAEELEINESDHTGDDSFLTQRLASKISIDARSQPRKRSTKAEHAVILLSILTFSERRMVDALRPSSRVTSSGQDLRSRRARNLHIRPCRGNGERLNSCDLGGTGDDATAIAVHKSIPLQFPGYREGSARCHTGSRRDYRGTGVAIEVEKSTHS